MRISRLVAVTVLFGLATCSLFAQLGASTDTAPSEPDLQTIASRIVQGNRGGKLEAIAELEQALDAGTFDRTSPAVFVALQPAVDAGLLTLNRTTTNASRAFDSTVRAKAVRVTGLLGTDQALQKLVTVFRKDTDSFVRIAALEGIGSIARDPQGEITRTIAYELTNERGARADQQLLLAAVNAIGAIGSDMDNVVDYRAQQWLIQVASDSGLVQVVRTSALNALKAISM